MQERKFFNKVKENITNLTVFGSRDTSITCESIIAACFKLKDDCMFVEYPYSQLREEKSASVSIGKRNMGKVKHTLLQKTYNIISSGGDFPKHNYTLCIDAIKVVSLMHNLQEKIQLKAGRLRNVTISGHDLKKITCVWARWQVMRRHVQNI